MAVDRGGLGIRTGQGGGDVGPQVCARVHHCATLGPLGCARCMGSWVCATVKLWLESSWPECPSEFRWDHVRGHLRSICHPEKA